MLTAQECRGILGPDCALSDVEVEALRNDLYALAEIATDSFVKQKISPKNEK